MKRPHEERERRRLLWGRLDLGKEARFLLLVGVGCLALTFLSFSTHARAGNSFYPLWMVFAMDSAISLAGGVSVGLTADDVEEARPPDLSSEQDSRVVDPEEWEALNAELLRLRRLTTNLRPATPKPWQETALVPSNVRGPGRSPLTPDAAADSPAPYRGGPRAATQPADQGVSSSGGDPAQKSATIPEFSRAVQGARLDAMGEIDRLVHDLNLLEGRTQHPGAAVERTEHLRRGPVPTQAGSTAVPSKASEGPESWPAPSPRADSLQPGGTPWPAPPRPAGTTNSLPPERSSSSPFVPDGNSGSVPVSPTPPESERRVSPPSVNRLLAELTAVIEAVSAEPPPPAWSASPITSSSDIRCATCARKIDGPILVKGCESCGRAVCKECWRSSLAKRGMGLCPPCANVFDDSAEGKA